MWLLFLQIFPPEKLGNLLIVRRKKRNLFSVGVLLSRLNEIKRFHCCFAEDGREMYKV